MRTLTRKPSTPAVVLPRFDFVDLRLFINVATAKSFTLGAEASALSLAAASMRVKQLEKAIGTPLLYRSKRGVSLTPAGEAFLRHAQRVFQLLDQMSADLRQYAKGVKGHVRLLANTTATTDFLPRVLSTFLAGHPHVDVDLREMRSSEIVQAVQEARADVGIVSGHVSTEGLETLPYYVDRMVLVVPRGHPLSGRGTVSFADALDHDFVGRNPESALHSFIADIVTSYGRRLKQRIQVGSFEEMCHLIGKGIGIGVVPLSAVQRLGGAEGIEVVRIEDDWSVQYLRICVRDSDALPDFVRELVDFLAADAAAARQGPSDAITTTGDD
ncbi:MAG TPA: LysR substrate-binding domain-containing protein [Burkholderiales bacterium]|nr:LysR substrate-binding domain-containing protein [Burkholderiales bacterium]